MRIHLVDGTYELFRAHYGGPRRRNPDGQEVGATVTLMSSLIALLREEEVTHIACAFDHVIESFRNDLFAGYKTGEGIEPELLRQFSLAERAGRALGIVIWPMVEFEADDVLATAARRWREKSSVEQIILCSPDKDLTQCVRGQKVVLLDRRGRKILDEEGVKHKFGVPPRSIPDWLALVGDKADGIPGITGWGEKSASRVLSRYRHLEKIPKAAVSWGVQVRGAERLARNLAQHWQDALLYRTLATLRTDVAIEEELIDLKWQGVSPGELESLCRELGLQTSKWLERVSFSRG